MIFFAIQMECKDKKAIEGAEAFQKIAASVGLTTHRLHFYMDSLSEMGLIQYDSETRMIRLTTRGEVACHVFPRASNVPDIEPAHSF